MRSEIKSKLSEIESKENVNIISARDVGSHAWGLSGPNSDYDIHIIFIENYNPHLLGAGDESLNTGKYETESIEFKSWSLRKFANLLESSNSSALMLSASPIEYAETSTDFESLCKYGIESFNLASLIGATIGKSRNNYNKYIKPTIIENKGTKKREFKSVENSYKTPDEEKGTLLVEPIDSDKDANEIPVGRIGDGKWRLIKQEKKYDEWVVTSEYNSISDLKKQNIITIYNEKQDCEREISVDEIHSPSERNKSNWDYRWSTQDRTVKRYLYIARGIMMSEYIASQIEFPSVEFDKLLSQYENLSDKHTDIPTTTLREFVQMKRNGEGDKHLDKIPHREEIEESFEKIKRNAFNKQSVHKSGPRREKINNHIKSLT